MGVRRTKSMKVISKSHFGLNISIKLNEMLIDAFVVLYGLRPKVIAKKDASKGP